MSIRRSTLPFLQAVLVLGAMLVSGSAAFAQAPELQGPLAEVRVEGTDTYDDIVRTLLTARPGTPVSDVDLEAERNRVYGLGTFASVSLSLIDSAAGPVLRVRVEENPTIGEIVFEGVSSVDTARLRTLLAREHLLEAGRVFNAIRADEATGTIADAYRAAGFPFRPTVLLETEAAPELAARDESPPLRVSYVVDESADLDEVDFGPSSVLDEEALEGIFARVGDQGTFELELFRAAVAEVAERYAEQGYRQSGVDLEGTTLSNGVLDVRFRELRIESIDTSNLDIDPEDLSLEPGDLFDYDTLLADVRRLAQGRSADVRLVPRVNAAGDVRVTFEVGPPDTAGPIQEVTIEGNTVLSDETLTSLLALQEGDTFTSTLAEEDFRRIYEAYGEAGYLIANQPSYNWLDGTYVQRVTEFRIADYALTWRSGEPATEDFVVLRELPEPGSVLSLDEIDAGLRALLRQGAVRPVDRQIVPAEAGEPEDVVVNVTLEAARTGLFQPAATYSTADGFSASFSVSEANLFRRAHNIEAEVDARTSDLGFLLGGSVRYTIPWLYVDLLDFREVPTSLSLSLYSDVRADQPISAEGSTRLPFPGTSGDENRVPVGEYMRRDTGFGVSVGRRLTPRLSLQASARASLTDVALEPDEACTLDEEGDVENRNECALPAELAAEYLPAGGAFGFVGTDLVYDGRDLPDFPRAGVAARASLGVGFGNDFIQDGERTGYAYQEVELGAKTYLALADVIPEVTDRNHVFAVRLDVGHQFGGAYPESKRFRVGRTPNEATQVRGYREGDFDLSRTYATASLEYRYDLELTTFATQTVIGIAFADAAWASGVPGFEEYDTPIFASAGLGVQLNLGFSGVALPALRFDYGFSERNPRGVFSFRIGTVF